MLPRSVLNRSGQKLWLNYLKPYVHEHFSDHYGTAVGIINPKSPFKVVIEAHADEISWFVNYVNPEGLALPQKKWRRRSPNRPGTKSVCAWQQRGW